MIHRHSAKNLAYCNVCSQNQGFHSLGAMVLFGYLVPFQIHVCRTAAIVIVNVKLSDLLLNRMKISGS